MRQDKIPFGWINARTQQIIDRRERLIFGFTHVQSNLTWLIGQKRF